MIRNNVDITLTTEQAAGITTGLDTLQDAMSFLVGVSPEDRKALFKLGPKSEAFVNTAMVAAADHADLLPPGILENMQRDENIRGVLLPVLTRLRQLTALAEGTYMLAGADLMKNGTTVYHVLRMTGYQEGLDPLLTELGARFRTRRSTDPEPEPEPETAP
ncbi:MAG: hypothetical protein ACO1QR_11970 [Chthoniobacteraceae bacterium]